MCLHCCGSCLRMGARCCGCCSCSLKNSYSGWSWNILWDDGTDTHLKIDTIHSSRTGCRFFSDVLAHMKFQKRRSLFCCVTGMFLLGGEHCIAVSFYRILYLQRYICLRFYSFRHLDCFPYFCHFPLQLLQWLGL